MKWNKYSIQTTTDAVDMISSALNDIGIEGIEIEDNVQLTKEEAKSMFVDFIPDLHLMMAELRLISTLTVKKMMAQCLKRLRQNLKI